MAENGLCIEEEKLEDERSMSLTWYAEESNKTEVSSEKRVQAKEESRKERERESRIGLVNRKGRCQDLKS